MLPAIDRDRARALLGETIRELGVLAMVFVPLDAVFTSPLAKASTVGVAIVFGLACIVGGILLETRN